MGPFLARICSYPRSVAVTGEDEKCVSSRFDHDKDHRWRADAGEDEHESIGSPGKRAKDRCRKHFLKEDVRQGDNDGEEKRRHRRGWEATDPQSLGRRGLLSILFAQDQKSTQMRGLRARTKALIKRPSTSRRSSGERVATDALAPL
jgi:hypothetical protein